MRAVAVKIRKNGRHVAQIMRTAREDGGSSLSLLFKLAWLYGIRQYSLREILGYGVLQQQPAVTVFISKQKSLAVLAKLNPPNYQCLTENKIIFDAICRAHGLPVPRCHSVIADGHIFTTAPGGIPLRVDPEALSLPDSFIVKPVDGAYGRAVTAWTRNGPHWTTHDGERETADAVVRKLISRSRSDGAFLLQERVYAHPKITELSGFSNAQGLRLTTLREPGGAKEATLLFGFFKLLGSAAIVDNFAFGYGGNVICAIDATQGTITRAWWREPTSGQLAPLDRHPETGRALQGFEIPCWDDVSNLVKRAADVFSSLQTIGWDVAITPTGPVLLEGNARWDPLFLEIVPRESWERVKAKTGSYGIV